MKNLFLGFAIFDVFAATLPPYGAINFIMLAFAAAMYYFYTQEA